MTVAGRTHLASMPSIPFRLTGFQNNVGQYAVTANPLLALLDIQAAPNAVRWGWFFPLAGQMADHPCPFRKGQGLDCVDDFGGAHWSQTTI